MSNDSKLSGLSAAAALTGAEILGMAQAGNSVRATVAQILGAGGAILATATPYNADPAGGIDSGAAINAAITAAAITGGVVLLPPGTYKSSVSLIQASNVTLSCYGATLNYTGAGAAISGPTTGVLLYAGIWGLTINGGSTAAILLSVNSGFNCVYRDIKFVSNSLTNTCLALDTNLTGTVSPDGTLNCVNCEFDNLMQVSTPGGNGCGYFITLNGHTSPATFVTNNTFINCQAQLVNIVGIDFIQWCDSNTFTGNTRIALNGSVATANGIGMRISSGAGGGVYAELFQQFSVDTFGSPGVDNRQGIVATNLLTPKFIVVQLFEFGPLVPNQAINIPAIISGYINQAPRGVTNNQAIYYPGSLLGVGLTPLNNIAVLGANNTQLTGGNQYTFFAQNTVGNFGSPSLGVGFGCTPGGISSLTPYTVTNSTAFYAAPGANGTNCTITNSYGFRCEDQSYGVSNFAFYSKMAAGAGKYAFYGEGAAPIYTVGPHTASAIAIPAGGTAGQGHMVSTTANFGVFFGSGVPTLSAAQGSLYLRSDGSTNVTRMYVNNSSGSGTTWTAVNTVA